MTRRQRKKKNKLAWTSKEFTFPTKGKPTIYFQDEQFKISGEKHENSSATVKIKNKSKAIFQFSFESYALSPEAENVIYDCPPQQEITITLDLGDYFSIQYR